MFTSYSIISGNMIFFFIFEFQNFVYPIFYYLCISVYQIGIHTVFLSKFEDL